MQVLTVESVANVIYVVQEGKLVIVQEGTPVQKRTV